MSQPRHKFEDLLSRLLDGELAPAERDELAELCQREPVLLARVREDLEVSELLRQALSTGSRNRAGKDDRTFIGGIELRLDGETHEFADLADRLINDEASSAELESLALRCHESPANAEELRSRLEIEDYLSQASLEHRSPEAFVDGLITRMWAEAEEDHFVDDLAPMIAEITEATGSSGGNILSFPSAKPARERDMPWVAVAACLVASLVAFFSFTGETLMKPSLAEVTSAKGDLRWVGDLRPVDGKFTKTGRYHLESGTATMSFASGDSITISDGADFEIQSENSIFVHDGVAIARVGENSAEKAGLIVRSKGVNVGESDQQSRQTGAIVGVDARTAGATEAIVFNGDAAVDLPELGKSRKLYDREAIRADLDHQKLYDVPYNPMRFAKVWELVSGVERNAGDVRVELPGTQLAPQIIAPDGRAPVQVFMENDTFIADSTLEVDTLTPGRFASTELAGQAAGQPLNLPGKSLRSYLLQLWPSQNTSAGSESFTPIADEETREASITFDHEIVGVIFSSDRLEQSDSLVGQHLNAMGGDISTLRGLDGGSENGDQILLSDDRRTLNVRLKNGGEDLLDHVRVIVALQ